MWHYVGCAFGVFKHLLASDSGLWPAEGCQADLASPLHPPPAPPARTRLLVNSNAGQHEHHTVSPWTTKSHPPLSFTPVLQQCRCAQLREDGTELTPKPAPDTSEWPLTLTGSTT